MSLQGKRVVVTRAPHQAEQFAVMLRERGAEPLLFPCIDIVPPQNTHLLDKVLRFIHEFDWMILTSPNTVIAIEKRIKALNLTNLVFSRLQVAAVGKKTADVAKKHLDVTVSVIPDKQTAAELAKTLPYLEGQRVFLPQSAIADMALCDDLTQIGAIVSGVPAYETVIGAGGVSHVDALGADVVTFTSGSTVRGFVERVGQVVSYPVVCIGSVTAAEARECGFAQIFSPQKDFTLTGMIDVLETIFVES